MSEKKIITLLEKQLELEKENVRVLRKEMKNIDHYGIKILFEVLAADSSKHASMVQMMLDVLRKGELSKETFVSTWKQRNTGLEAIRDHIEREKKMIELIKEEVLATENKTIKALLKYILTDEKQHHNILKKEIWEI